MNQVISLCTVLVICQSWTGRAAIVPGIMDLLNIDVTTLPTVVNTWPPTKPGQVNSPPCTKTKYGCCRDWHTPSPGPNEEGCAKKLCYDDFPGDCLIKKMTKTLDCTPGGYDFKHCTYRCGVCKLPASPISRCQRLNPASGCCWDGTIPLDRYGSGCQQSYFPAA
ncbi:papilin-like isoform X2 [Actinia tenebrosa]|uniref:Papilin-like isoform X2 n=1 Tax=Actinia tenebrosa TaxID=6105 RepID=A0A6P8H1Q0_ACTTE|nr:papilin-like isoform X2 [Actinia tenebrosa]